MAKSKQPQVPAAPKTTTRTIILAPGVIEQLAALEQQAAACEAQKNTLMTTALLQAGVTGQISVVGFDPATRKVTVHVQA